MDEKPKSHLASMTHLMIADQTLYLCEFVFLLGK